MKFDTYQEEAHKTAVYRLPTLYQELSYVLLGLSGEAGELAGKFSKVLRKDSVIDEEVKKDYAKELGDVLWFVAETATVLGLSLDDVAKGNLEKLASRQQRGVLHGNGDNR